MPKGSQRAYRRVTEGIPKVKALTVLVKIKRGEEEALNELLTSIGKSPQDNPHIRFSEDLKTHCARWAITRDSEHGPRLLLAAEFDGDLDDYIANLLATTPDIDDIWGKCEGYSGRKNFPEFIRANSFETQAFYIAFRDETVGSIRDKMAARQGLEQLLDQPYPWMPPLLDMLSRVPQSIGWWQCLKDWLSIRKTALGVWTVNLLLAIIKPIVQIGETKNFPRVSSVCGPGQRLRVQAPTAGLNGQMITITDVKPGVLRYIWLRISLGVNEFLGGYCFPPGLFAYVGTLYSFRWVLIDNRKRLVFLSVFDGTWQNYMGDFIDKIIWALDGIYNNTTDYPPGGMSEIDAFKAFILAHQFEPQILYKAYPHETVMNLIRDRQINSLVGDDILKKLGIETQKVASVLETL